ncbi:MAG: peptidoglycan DD-metalloendopeptidase family protein [Bacteroidetes bacterium]|nr:peptidoglycan DD-metalloendopeptidase family protein [Bacteroidota bacterium]MBL6943242.1 peptidoglycan DD-metalloendopeptidase family protein [Bacteroidales bacterium]
MIGKRFCILFFVLIFNNQVFTQEDQKQLEAKREKLTKEIAYTNKLLSETQTNKTATLNQLRLLNVKISKRENLIATLKTEIYQLNNKIDKTESALFQLNEKLRILKQKYSKIAWHAFRYKTAYNKLIFLFSADDINQAYQRMRYLDQISSYIRKEAESIKETEEEKSKILVQLKDEILKKKNLLDNEQSEILEIEKEQAEKNRIKADLQSREKHLRNSIRDKEKEASILAKQIQKIIAVEIAPKKDATTGGTYELTPSEKELSLSFASNQGKLPWPTERGVISETFGVHNHPVLKKVRTKNNGINIITAKNGEARAVFSGKVVSITKISNTNIAVIIKHGEFFTVYSNLDKVFVNKGDDVDTKELIGRIHTNLDGKTELHFEVWRGTSIQNPSYWVSQK